MRNRTLVAVLTALALSLAAAAGAAETTAIEASPLEQRIVAFIADHPEAGVDEVAAFANAELAQHGLTYQFDDFDDESGALTLQGEGRTFVLDYGGRLDSGPCGEWFVAVPAVAVGRTWIDLAQEGRVWRVTRPETLYLDTMTVMTADQSAVTATIEVPWQSVPAGVTADGRGVVVRDYIAEDPAVRAWWERLRRNDPAISSDDPFLPLIVSEDAVRYADDAALLREPASNGAREVESSENAYLRQEEFVSPNYVVEYSLPCT